ERVWINHLEEKNADLEQKLREQRETREPQVISKRDGKWKKKYKELSSKVERREELEQELNTNFLRSRRIFRLQENLNRNKIKRDKDKLMKELKKEKNKMRRKIDQLKMLEKEKLEW
ncbi:34845_t:CDS:2, partial [Racocetra persica]